MTVYVVQENNRLDYSPAEVHGDIVFMTANEYRPVAYSLINIETENAIRNHMAKFNPEEDHLLLTGSPILIGYSFHLAMQMRGFVRCLQWDRFTNAYREVVFNPTKED